MSDYLNSISKFDIYATQVSSRQFLCHEKEIALPKLIVGRRFISSALHLHSLLTKNSLYLSIPENKTGVTLNGQKIAQHQPIISAHNQEIFTRIPDDYDNYYFIVPVFELAKYLTVEAIEQIQNITYQVKAVRHFFIPSTEHQHQLRSLIKTLTSGDAGISYQAVLDIQDTIMELLSKILTINSALSKSRQPTQARSLVIVKRALTYIHKDNKINLNSCELAAVSFCCIRSLENAFKAVLDMTPKQYLIKRRMQLIYEELKTEGGLLISETITKFGVVNQGRFAQDYYKFYGEYPHQTRKRSNRVLVLDAGCH